MLARHGGGELEKRSGASEPVDKCEPGLFLAIVGRAIDFSVWGVSASRQAAWRTGDASRGEMVDPVVEEEGARRRPPLLRFLFRSSSHRSPRCWRGSGRSGVILASRSSCKKPSR